MTESTPGIPRIATPIDWKTHRFGLPESRWRALQDVQCWVTGAGTGFGRAISVALGLAGATVFLTGRRLAKLEETRQDAISWGADASRLHALPADIRDSTAIDDIKHEIGRQKKSLNGLVHCAALPQRPSAAPLRDMNESDWHELMDTNVTASWLTTRAALSLMNRSGRAVLFTSEAGWTSTSGFGPYNISKAALNNLGMSIAAEAEGTDLQINVLNPGEAHTEMNRGSQDSPYEAVCMTLLLLSHPPGGPNGHFFHRDGRHLSFCSAAPFPRTLA